MASRAMCRSQRRPRVAGRTAAGPGAQPRYQRLILQPPPTATTHGARRTSNVVWVRLFWRGDFASSPVGSPALAYPQGGRTKTLTLTEDEAGEAAAALGRYAAAKAEIDAGRPQDCPRC
jgi:hypothetical protein